MVIECFPSVLEPPHLYRHPDNVPALIDSQLSFDMRRATAEDYNVLSTALNDFKAATSDQGTRADNHKLRNAISKLATKGISVKESGGHWAALIGAPDDFSWDSETRHIDEVRVSFAGPSRPQNRVFLLDPDVVLPAGEDCVAPVGSWEFVEQGLCFTPSSVDCTRLDCSEYSASAILTPTMLLQGGMIALGARYPNDGLTGLPALTITEMNIPEGKEKESLEEDLLSFQTWMLKEMAKSDAVKRFQESVRSRNLTIASNDLARILVDTRRAIGSWTGSHEWAATTVVVKKHPVLQSEDSSDEGDDEDNKANRTDKDISDTEAGDLDTPSPTDTTQSWVCESNERPLRSNDDLSEWEA